MTTDTKACIGIDPFHPQQEPKSQLHEWRKQIMHVGPHNLDCCASCRGRIAIEQATTYLKERGL